MYVSFRTIFFLHGSMANMKQFKEFIAHFANDYNIVAFDALGCGDSPKPHMYTGIHSYICMKLFDIYVYL